MKIKLSQIKPSPNPIRKTWDEEKMNDLRWSLMEEGQVEPIKIRPTSNKHYEIVYGHRRVEAARRAGWDEIEAIVDEIPNDVDALIQAGIENLAGEDMTDDDKSNWVYRLNTKHGMSLREISRRSSVGERAIRAWANLIRQKKEGVEVRRVAAAYHIDEISRALGDDTEAKKAVADKVSNEDFGPITTREVARAYRDAPTDDIKQKILENPVTSKDTADDILRRAKFKVEMEQGVDAIRETQSWKHERDERREMDAWDYAVKEFLDTTRMYTELARKGHSLIKFGKFSPEAARFTARKIDALIDVLKNYKEELEQVS